MRALCTVFILGVAVALSLLGSPESSSGARAPVCPNRADLVRTFPPTYIRAGRPVFFAFERDRLSITSVRVTYPTRKGANSERFRFPRGRDRVKVLRSAPGKPRRFRMTFMWRQNSGQANACRGVDEYRRIPIVPRKAHVGRTDVSRFAGRYRANYGRSGGARWRLRPVCDYFACKSRLRSSGQLKGKFVPRRGNRYTLYSKESAGYCVVTSRLTGQRRKYKMYGDIRVALRVKRQRNGVATRLVGRRFFETYTAGDPYDTCERLERSTSERVSVRRRG